MINDKKSGKTRFTFVDAFIIALILLLVIFLVIYFIKQIQKDVISETANMEYTVEIRGVDPDFLEKIPVGKEIWDTNGVAKIGKIKSVSYSPSVFTYIGEDETTAPNIQQNDAVSTDITEMPETLATSDSSTYKNLKAVNYPDKIDITVVISAYATKENNIYKINGYAVCVGEKAAFRTEEISLWGICIKAVSLEETETFATTIDTTASSSQTSTSALPEETTAS